MYSKKVRQVNVNELTVERRPNESNLQTRRATTGPETPQTSSSELTLVFQRAR